MNFLTGCKGIILTLSLLAMLSASNAVSEDQRIPLRIGVLTDMSGTFSDISGPGAVTAVKMAVEDFGGEVLGRPIEVLVSDHQNKSDVAMGIAREWIEVKHIAMIQDLMNSAVALAVNQLVAQANRISIVNGAASSRITNDACTANTIAYTSDTYAWAKGTAQTLVKRHLDSWFFLAVDYELGKTLFTDAAAFVAAAGGNVLGVVRHPLNTTDFSSFLMQAQSAHAKVIGVADAGSGLANLIRNANEFGIRNSDSQIAALALNITDVRAMGLDVAQGLLFTEAFYWDLNQETRSWSKRFKERAGKIPTSVQAGDYSSTMHYLKAVKAAGTDEAGAVMAKMKELRINDFFAKDGYIREDGRMIHDLYLGQVKAPADSKYDWDYYKILETIPGDQAFRPLSASSCPLIKH